MTSNNPDAQKCSAPELQDLYFLYINSDLTLQESARIEEHLSKCAECQEDMKFLLDLKQAYDDRRQQREDH